jgi:hypothetical protein
VNIINNESVSFGYLFSSIKSLSLFFQLLSISFAFSLFFVGVAVGVEAGEV